MLSVDEALQRVVEHAGVQPIVRVPLSEATGLVLAEPAVADLDSPPFTKALMDGFAVRNEDLAGGKAELRIVGEITAGNRADRPLQPGTAYRIMTGAPMPEGAQAVVMVERSSVRDNRVTLDDQRFRPGQNVMLQGREMTKGQTVLEAGVVIGPAEAGMLATVGCARPRVYRRPRVALLSTGDEIITPDQTPSASQIRNSNGSTLTSLVLASGAEVVDLGIARDDPAVIQRRVTQGLECDFLLLTGGVSAGARDFVPQALADAGVRQVFHKVDLKPGKPVWFGEHDNGLVFGLPGNPVSVLVCFELFVRTALRARQSIAPAIAVQPTARLKADFTYPTDRETFHPAKLYWESEGLWVEPVSWFGSPDLRALTAANALLRCPVSADGKHPRGSLMTVVPLTRPQSILD